MGKGTGFGKIIFFGEHFAVYGVPAIVSALDLTTEAVVTRKGVGGICISDHRVGSHGYTEGKRQQQTESLERMFRHLGVDPIGLEIALGGDLPVFSGIGASAASSVAIARAISDEFRLDLTDEQVNEAAHEAERAYHGEKTAGVDNLAATYGGLIWFKPGQPPEFERLALTEPFEVLVANTGLVADTKAMIEGVAERRSKYPEQYDRLIEEAQTVVQRARQALTDGDRVSLGSLMTENHALLQAIEVSCRELDYLVDLAMRSGALGAKQTGGGGGGCIVALTPGKELQDKVARAIESEGFAVMRATIHRWTQIK